MKLILEKSFDTHTQFKILGHIQNVIENINLWKLMLKYGKQSLKYISYLLWEACIIL